MTASFARTFACVPTEAAPDGAMLRIVQSMLDETVREGPSFYGEVVTFADGTQWLIGSPSLEEDASIVTRVAKQLGHALTSLELALDLDALDAYGEDDDEADSLPSGSWRSEWFVVRPDGSREAIPSKDDVPDFRLHGDEGETLDAELWRRLPKKPLDRVPVSGKLLPEPGARNLSPRVREICNQLTRAGRCTLAEVAGQTMLKIEVSPGERRLARVTPEELEQIAEVTGIRPG